MPAMGLPWWFSAPSTISIDKTPGPGLTAGGAPAGSRREPLGFVRDRPPLAAAPVRAGPFVEESGGLDTVAGAAQGLQVGVFQRRAASRDLDDVVDLELSSSGTAAARLAGVPVAAQDHDPRGVPEEPPVELPSALGRAVRRSSRRKLTVALHALTGQSSLPALLGPRTRPPQTVADDPPGREARSRVETVHGTGGLPSRTKWGRSTRTEETVGDLPRALQVDSTVR